jgi:glycosyltransferase involved in cell wall biosynthesis
MIEVVYLIGSLPRAGAGRHLFQLVTALDRSRFHPRVLCLRREGELVDVFEAAGVTVEGLDVPAVRSPMFVPRILGLVPALRRLSPDVLHTYLFPSNLFGSILGRTARVPVIVTSRRSMSEIEPRRHLRAYRTINWLADGIVAVSGASADSAVRAEGLDRSRITVIENGMDAEPYAGGHDPALKTKLFGLPPGARLAGMVSNFRRLKGQDDFIEMAAILVETAARAGDSPEDIRFVIVGEGPGREAAEEKVRALGLQDRFTFAGLRGDIPDVLRSLDVFLYPSHSEGISNALMEAMAAGCPIVAARCEGNETVLGESAAVFVPPADPSALAIATARLLARGDEARSVGAAAHERLVNRFGARRMAGGFEDLYIRCLGRKGRVVPGQTDSGDGTGASGAPDRAGAGTNAVGSAR